MSLVGSLPLSADHEVRRHGLGGSPKEVPPGRAPEGESQSAASRATTAAELLHFTQTTQYLKRKSRFAAKTRLNTRM